MSETLPLFSNGAGGPAGGLSPVAQTLRDLLASAPEPWAAAQIRKLWPARPTPKPAVVEAALAELEAAGVAHRLAGARGTALWSVRPLAWWLQEAERKMRDAVAASPSPVAGKKLLAAAWPKALDAAPLRARLEEMARQGVLKLWPGKTPAWWRLSPEEAIGEVLLEALDGRALTRAEWVREAKARLKGPSAAQWQQEIARLADSGRVLAHAARIDGKRVEAFVRAERRAALLELYRPLVERLREEWRRLGIPPDEIERFLAGRSAPPAEALLEELRRLEQESPPPNPVSRLRARAALRHLTKAEFDGAALELLRQGRIYMAPHDHPAALSAAERDQMVSGGEGTWYVSITARR